MDGADAEARRVPAAEAVAPMQLERPGDSQRAESTHLHHAVHDERVLQLHALQRAPRADRQLSHVVRVHAEALVQVRLGEQTRRQGARALRRGS